MKLKRRTVYSFTPLRSASSSVRLFFFFPSPASSAGLTSAARRFFPETSSASLCCRSDGVSVHNELSTFLSAGAAERENCRAFNFVGSRSTIHSIRYASVRKGTKTHCQVGRRKKGGLASIRPFSELWVWQLPNWFLKSIRIAKALVLMTHLDFFTPLLFFFHELLHGIDFRMAYSSW